MAHVKSAGSGGKDEEWNLIPLCRTHHIAQHREGWNIFIAKHEQVESELRRKGWNWEFVFGRFCMTRKEPQEVS